MKHRLLIGSKIRRLRKRAALTQVGLAARLGISPSYLNLIEHNQRALTRPILLNLGEVLQIDPHALSGGEEGRLLSDLTEVFGDPVFKGDPVGQEDLTRLVGAAPDVAGSVMALYRAYRDAREEAANLSEHLADNPFLETTSHRLLTLLTSVRSFSEILRDNADLAADRRQQYIGTVVSESEKLTDLVNELFGFISGEGLSKQRKLDTPSSLVADYLEASGNYSAELEDAAQDIRRALGIPDPRLDSALIAHLSENHGISVEISPWKAGEAGSHARLAHFDEEARCLRLSEILPPSSRSLEMARQLALAAAGPLLDRMAAPAGLEVPAAIALLRQAQSEYLAAAILMPYREFLEAARDLRHDLDVLQRRFGVGFEQVCQRLTTLQQPGAEGVPFHFLRVDLAGNIIQRRAASGLRIPRFGGACPRWNVHRAFMNPGRIDTQLARLPDGTAYIFLARAQRGPSLGHGTLERHYSVSIGCDVSYADALVYADGLGLQDDSSFTPVGLHCRQCAWHDCGDRAYPSFLR